MRFLSYRKIYRSKESRLFWMLRGGSRAFLKSCRKNFMRTAALLCLALWPASAFAHEAYVENGRFFWTAMHSRENVDLWAALNNPHDLFIFVGVTLGVVSLLILNFFFRRSDLGQRVHHQFERLAFLGPIFVRFAIAAAFFFSAATNSFLGPELGLAHLPASGIVKGLLYITSLCFLIGLGTELAALIALALFVMGCGAFGGYMTTYVNYLGEILVLLLFGMRRWSLDRRLFGPLRGWRERWQDCETTVVRVFYGIALIYAAVTVKFLHPEITIQVIEDWHLTQFHWLFPSDPVLVTLGSGIAEVAIGLFILIGFELRITVLISLFYITLSLIYFREAVWPHLMLYGISLNLLVQPETFSVDRLIFERRPDQQSRLVLGRGHKDKEGYGVADI